MERSCFLLLFLFLSSSPAVAANFPIALPGCSDKCGDINVPYPFGITKDCYREGFGLLCDNSTNFNSPKLFMSATVPTTIEVTNINLLNSTATILYTNITEHCNNDGFVFSSIDLGPESPWTFSYSKNKLTAVGCDTMALYSSSGNDIVACASYCSGLHEINNNTCSGVGCCQVTIRHGQKTITTILSSVFNYTNTTSRSNCSHAFPVEEDWFKFKISDVIEDFTLKEVPVILDWAIGNQTCEEAKIWTMTTHFVCGDNSRCLNSSDGPGYQCACKDGFEGNPYLPTGCQDIDECSNSNLNNCLDNGICTNTHGSYKCSCPDGKQGDGTKNGKGCNDIPKSNKNNKLPLQLSLGIGFGIVLLCAIIGFMWYLGRKKRKMMRLREKYFEQNGGELLKHKSMHEGGGEGVVYTARIFTEDELKTATRNFSEERVIGRGGNGTVYMGILKDSTVVAIKKSKMIEDQTDFQKEQFINEVIILSQVIHRNVVKIVGCCLETQVPLLVYEYIPNNTLYHHIHEYSFATSYPLSWSTRLCIVAETADAVAYLHSSLSTPVIHRDIKSANILLDDNFTTKVSDFGASRLVPLSDKVEIATMVQGTLGYLDPEYFHTGQLSDKSDVYSFGVVMAEVLTGHKPISFSRAESDRNLASCFLKCLKEDRLVEILEPIVVRECAREVINEVALLTKACLCPTGEQRPSMKEVAAELQKIKGHGKSNQTTSNVNDDQLGSSGWHKTRNVKGGGVMEDGGSSIGQSGGQVNGKWSIVLER